MSVLDWFRPPHRPGLRNSEAARLWAHAHFPEPQRRIAALVAGILCEQTGADFAELRPSTHFLHDMSVFDFFDTVDYVKAVQLEFALAIPEPELDKMHLLSDLVEYVWKATT
jgi:acyl carrier protein